MRRVLPVFLLVLPLYPADSPKVSAPVALTEVQRLRFANVLLRQEIARRDLALAQKEQERLVIDACEAAKIPLAECSVDLETAAIKQVKPPAPEKGK